MYARLATLKNCHPLFHKLKFYFKDGVFIFLAIIPHAKLSYVPKKNNYTLPWQTVSFAFLASSCFPRPRLGKHRESKENKTNCFPQGQ